MSLEVISGPMFAGKTTELIRRVERADIAGKDVQIYKPEKDTRTEEAVKTHRGREMSAEYISDLDQFKVGTRHDLIAFDEAQFFDEELAWIADYLATGEGVEVVVAGLSTDFRGEAWSPMPELMARADNVIKLTSICEECGKKATRTQRLHDGEPAYEDEELVYIGDDDHYEARCRKCHNLKKR